MRVLGRPHCWNSIVRGVIPLDRSATAHTKHNNDLETHLFLLQVFKKNSRLHILGWQPFLSLNESDISKDNFVHHAVITVFTGFDITVCY